MLSEPGDMVLDPFSGRGTTLLESRLLGRIPIAADLNPVAIALSRAKSVTVSQGEVRNRLSELRANYDSLLYLPEAQVQSDDIQLIYHHATLGQLCYLRRKLLLSEAATDIFLLGSLLGIMHGSERQDGTSAYASISMPNTFSMSPNYVRVFVEKNRLNRVFRNVFELLDGKIDRLFRDIPPQGSEGLVIAGDAKRLSELGEIGALKGGIKLVVTSPPYLNVVNYARQNWIRSWLLAPDPISELAASLDDNLSLKDWLNFIGSTVTGLKGLLTPDGVLVMVVGDVAKASRSHISLARELIRWLRQEGLFSFIGCLDDYIGHDVKTTRIWGDTKGRATIVDRVIVLANVRPLFNTASLPLALGVPPLGISNISTDELEANATALAGAAP